MCSYISSYTIIWISETECEAGERYFTVMHTRLSEITQLSRENKNIVYETSNFSRERWVLDVWKLHRLHLYWFYFKKRSFLFENGYLQAVLFWC